MAKTATGVLLALFCVAVSAQTLTPQTYVAADVAAREITLDGMREQVDLLQQQADGNALVDAALSNQDAVEAAFDSYGTSGAAHTAYGTRQREAIEAWLAAQPGWQAVYDDLDAQFSSLSQQLDSLREGQ